MLPRIHWFAEYLLRAGSFGKLVNNGWQPEGGALSQEYRHVRYVSLINWPYCSRVHVQYCGQNIDSFNKSPTKRLSELSFLQEKNMVSKNKVFFSASS